jgi:hypothetical protein
MAVLSKQNTNDRRKLPVTDAKLAITSILDEEVFDENSVDPRFGRYFLLP